MNQSDPLTGCKRCGFGYPLSRMQNLLVEKGVKIETQPHPICPGCVEVLGSNPKSAKTFILGPAWQGINPNLGKPPTVKMPVMIAA